MKCSECGRDDGHFVDCSIGIASTQAGSNKSLVVSATATARWVEVITYVDDAAKPVRHNLSFKTPEEAAECARVLSEARRPTR